MVQFLPSFKKIEKLLRRRSPPELPIHSGHVAPPIEKDSGSYHVPSPGSGVTANIGKGSPKVQAQIEEKPIEADGEPTDDEIRQRTPPNRYLQSDGQHSYRQGSILSGKQVASQPPTPRSAIGKTTDDEIHQRTPPNRPLQSDGQHSDQQGLIGSVNQVASQGEELEAVRRLGRVSSYRSLFGGGTLRDHPKVEETSVEARAHVQQCETTDEKLPQRAPSNASLHSDSKHQGSIRSGDQVASHALTPRPAISEAIDDGIHQRTPLNQPLQPDGQHSYQRGSILSGRKVDSQPQSLSSALSEATVDEIRQRTPPNQSFQSDSQHSYQQGSILSGKLVASQGLSLMSAISETAVDEIHQRTPPNQPLQSDGQHSYRQGSILSGKQVASPFSDPDMLPLVPRTPIQGDRYTRERIPPDALEGSQVIFKSGPQPIQKFNNLPDEWIEDIHPEGQLLYSKVVSSCGLSIRVHTDLPLRSTENHPVILAAFGRLSELLGSSEELHNAQLTDSEVEACILVSDDFPDEFGYYLVNHRDQTTFWLQEVNASDLDMWAYDEDIYRHKLAEQYWRHVTDFPHYCCLSPKVWEQLGPLMLLGAVDQEYCEDSTAPKDAETLARLEGFWRQAKVERDADCNKAACNWICARLWYDLVTPRIHNFWGTDYARLERTITVGDDPRPSQAHQQKYSWLIRFICAFLLWDEPAVTMRLLDDAWPGGIIYPKPWREMMTTFSNEWEKIFLLSTVTFAGAIAFIAVPLQALQGSPDPQGLTFVTSFAICCGIACCAFSVASLIAASNLKRDFGGKIAQDVHEAGSYLRSLYSDSLGYLKWGICLSLPRVLFQWAVVSFCVGLVVLAFQLHHTQIWFFYTEISIATLLAGAVVTGRYLSPDRIKPEWFLGRTFTAAQSTVLNAKNRASTQVSTWLSRRKVTGGDQKSTASQRSNRSQPKPFRIIPKSIPKASKFSTTRDTVSSAKKRANTLVSNWLPRGKEIARSHSRAGSLRSNRSHWSARDSQSIRAQPPAGDFLQHNMLGLQIPSLTRPDQARISAIK